MIRLLNKIKKKKSDFPSNEEIFYKEYRSILLRSSIGGLYIPGIDIILPTSFCKYILSGFSYLTITIFVIFIIESTVHLFNDETTEGEVYFRSSVIIIFTLNITKLIYMAANRKQFRQLFKFWVTSFQQNLFEEDRVAFLKEEKTRLKNITNWQFTMMFVPCFLWGLSPILTGKTSMKTGFSFNQEEPPQYYFVVIYQVLFSSLCGSTWASYDGVMMLHMSLVTVELTHLENCLYKLCRLDTYHKNTMEMDIKTIVVRHNEICRYSELVRDFYSPMLACHYMYICYYTCFESYLIANGSLNTFMDLLTSFMFMAANLLFLYITCWFGDRIAFKSSELTLRPFGEDWYSLPQNIKKNLKMIFIRVKKPLQINAFGLFPLGATSFVWILRTAYSCYAFLSNKK